MGLLDNVAGAVIGNMLGGDKGGMAKIAMEMFNQNGGLGGLLTKFNDGGLADVAGSWVGQGDNIPVSSNQITDILGSDMVANMAEQFGISPDILSGQLAEHLPGVIDKMTPDGEVNDKSGDLLGTVLGMLK